LTSKLPSTIITTTTITTTATATTTTTHNYKEPTQHHATSTSYGWGDRCKHSKKHNSNHLSVHQWIRCAIHASQLLTSLYFPIFETSATALCGPIGNVFHHCCMIFSILYIRRCIQHSGVFLRFLKQGFWYGFFYFYMHTYFLLMSHICIHILSTQFHKFPWVCQTKSKVRHTFVNCLDPLSCCLKVQNFNQIVKGWLNPGWQTQRSWTG
jgi:hypothetical protein